MYHHIFTGLGVILLLFAAINKNDTDRYKILSGPLHVIWQSEGWKNITTSPATFSYGQQWNRYGRVEGLSSMQSLYSTLTHYNDTVIGLEFDGTDPVSIPRVLDDSTYISDDDRVNVFDYTLSNVVVTYDTPDTLQVPLFSKSNTMVFRNIKGGKKFVLGNSHAPTTQDIQLWNLEINNVDSTSFETVYQGTVPFTSSIRFTPGSSQITTHAGKKLDINKVGVILDSGTNTAADDTPFISVSSCRLLFLAPFSPWTLSVNASAIAVSNIEKCVLWPSGDTLCTSCTYAECRNYYKQSL